MNINEQIDYFSSKTQVSRETLNSLKEFENIIKKANKNLNLVGKSTINDIWIRHFLDCAQVIDFIEKKGIIITDLGSGAGFPGIILEIMTNDRKNNNNFRLIEKSPKKSLFLKAAIKKLNLKAKVENIDVIQNPNKFDFDVVVARAFKPLEFILKFFNQKVKKWDKIFLFLGKTGKNDLLQASKLWDIKYKQRISLTSADSLILEINKIEKKIE